MNDPDDTDAQEFLEYLSRYDLVNHVHEPTHKLGNNLDLVITSKDSSQLKNLIVDFRISAHNIIRFKIDLQKRPLVRNEITFGRFKSIDMTKFSAGLDHNISSLPVCDDPGSMV